MVTYSLTAPELISHRPLVAGCFLLTLFVAVVATLLALKVKGRLTRKTPSMEVLVHFGLIFSFLSLPVFVALAGQLGNLEKVNQGLVAQQFEAQKGFKEFSFSDTTHLEGRVSFKTPQLEKKTCDLQAERSLFSPVKVFVTC